jgi:hypothetical protein
MLAFRLLPPMTPAARTRRLLALTLRDLRRLSRGRPWVTTDWTQRIYGRISALPSSVDTLQAARLAAALSLGRELIRLRQLAGRFALRAELERAMVAIGAGNSEAAIRELDDLGRALAALSAEKPGAKVRLRTRATIRSAAHTLKQYASYFDAEVPG